MKSPALLCALLCALGFLPLLGGFRYEAALAAGLVAPSWTACAAFVLARRRAQERLQSSTERTRVQLAPWAFEIGARHAAAILLAAALHDAVRGTCEFWPGFALVLLGPVFGTFLGAAFGTAIGGLAPLVLRERWSKSRALVLLAPLGPLTTALYALGEFYWGPAIYAYDPFAGSFAGPLYDTIPFDLERLVIFRTGSALTLLACWSLGEALVWDPTSSRPRLTLERSKSLLVFAISASASLTTVFVSTDLNLATTPASLARELSGHVERGVCRIQHSPWVSPAVAERVGWECVGHVRALRQHFDLPGQGAPLTVHLFASAEEKGRLMGARTTYLAKPWRREVFVQVDAFPHPVLGHELAHVVAGEFGAGPFRVAGSVFGLVPDPGRVEGFAVAAAPTEEGDATEAEWARALLDLGQLPTSSHLFSLGFLGSAAVKSYTAAGAFVAHLHVVHGPAVMKRWYRGEDLEKLTGKSWAVLDDEYRQALAKERVSPRVRALAAEIFSRPSLFGRSCPHAADRALERAHALCSVNATAAHHEVERALDLDPTRRDAEGLLPSCYLAGGQPERARATLGRLRTSPQVSTREKVRASITSADLAWDADRDEEARAGYDAALHGALTGAEARSVSMKRWALDRPEPVRSAVRRLLAAGEPHGADPAARLAALFDWHATGPDRGVASYLLGLQLLDGDPLRGRALLEQALGSGELRAPFVVEAERRLLIAACLNGDTVGLHSAADALAGQDEVPVQARRAPRLRARCEVGAPP